MIDKLNDNNYRVRPKGSVALKRLNQNTNIIIRNPQGTNLNILEQKVFTYCFGYQILST